jgi:pimeloyl-ACP methyl ester carboxylesterase
MTSSGVHDTLPRTRAPGPLLRLMELRAPWEFASALVLGPLWGLAPAGDAHPVLVLPGLAADDDSTAVMRNFLASLGYAVSGWGQGRNLGMRPGVLDEARDTLRQLWARHERKVSLIGWSLGGIFARELAKDLPGRVRGVVTLGSPFTGQSRETNAWRLYERASKHRIDSHDLYGPLRAAPPVPTTSIWSRTDGVVSWRRSVEPRQHEAENIEVEASHCGMGAHPAVLYALADRLAQPEGAWQPFHRQGWRRLVYGDTQHVRSEYASA